MDALGGFAALTPLEGGWSGLTFRADSPHGPQVVRLYPPGDAAGGRGEAAAQVDAALLHLVRGLLPVPEVIEVRRPRADLDQPGLLVTTFLPGERGDLLLPRLDEAGLRDVGRAVGEVAATLAAMPQLRPGPFVDADLRLGSWGHADLTDHVAAHLAALGGWTPSERDALVGMADDAQDLLDAVGRCTLVHSDLNPKNLLLDPRTLAVTGVLDWEFAHAGLPVTDLGNLLRFERGPRWAGYADAVLAAWCDRHGGTVAETAELARAADLWALVDLAARRGAHPVADRAHELLLAMARAGRTDVACEA